MQYLLLIYETRSVSAKSIRRQNWRNIGPLEKIGRSDQRRKRAAATGQQLQFGCATDGSLHGRAVCRDQGTVGRLINCSAVWN